MEGLGNNINQSENTENFSSLEQFGIAEKVAKQKLEFLLGENPTKQFAVRFMSLEEYKALMEGRTVGLGEANVYGAPIKYRPDLLVSPQFAQEMQERKSQGRSVENSLAYIHNASVKREQMLQGIGVEAVPLPEYPEDIDDIESLGEDDFMGKIPSVHLSKEEQEEVYTPTFQGFLEEGVGHGWRSTIKEMTDWDMSARAVGNYSGFGDRQGVISAILNKTSKEAKQNNFEGKTGEEKKVYFLELLRNKLLDNFSTIIKQTKLVVRGKERELEDLKQNLKIQEDSQDNSVATEKLKEKISQLEEKLNNSYMNHLNVVNDFMSDENYLKVPGNLQKVFYALANIEDIEEFFEGDPVMRKFQYQVAVAFKAAESPEDAHWGRKQWGYADSGKEGILAAVALIPNPELEENLKKTSKENEESAFPVFNSYGSLKFPELNR